jgi:hypothetical protein
MRVLAFLAWGIAVLARGFAILVCIVAMLLLGGLVVSIWQGWPYIPLDQFLSFRKGLAIFVVVYALWCFGRLTANVAMPRELPPEFVPELIAISVFWVLAPPIWFFVEYFAVATDCIIGLPGNPTNLKTIKDYADYASKIWAGVLALFLALIALKK